MSRVSKRSVRTLASWAIPLTLLAAWWLTFAPTLLHGPVTYVMVTGQSMEPMLHTGDLAVIHTHSPYELGDLVVFNVDGGFVIHRLVGGNATNGWITQGDNKPYRDDWLIPDDQIQGEYWFMVPQVSNVLTSARANPLPLAAGLAVVTLLGYLPWHRRRIAAELAEALTTATREPRREGRSNSEFALLLISAAATLLAGVALVNVFSRHLLVSAVGIATGLAVLFAGALTAYFALRLFDGTGEPEPAKSLRALSGRLYRTPTIPTICQTTEHLASAVELRKVAEHYRLPVLHHIDPETDIHTFVLITQGHGCYSWSPPMQTSRADAKQGACAS